MMTLEQLTNTIAAGLNTPAANFSGRSINNSNYRHIYRYLLLYTEVDIIDCEIKNPYQISKKLNLCHATLLNTLDIIDNALLGYDEKLFSLLSICVKNLEDLELFPDDILLPRISKTPSKKKIALLLEKEKELNIQIELLTNHRKKLKNKLFNLKREINAYANYRRINKN